MRVATTIFFLTLVLSVFAGTRFPDDDDLVEFPYDVQCEDTCTHIHGIDMSHYQKEVFWEAVGDDKQIAYVYLKATEGGDHIDRMYEQNIELANKHGLKVGSYHFYRPITEQKKQLQNFMTQCLPGQQDLVPMIDIETTNGLSSEAFRDSLFKFLDMVEAVYKQKPLLYTFTNFYNKHLCGAIDGYMLMIAQYTEHEPELRDGKEYIMWQYTCKGIINGVTGYVDKSRFMGTHGLREIRYRR